MQGPPCLNQLDEVMSSSSRVYPSHHRTLSVVVHITNTVLKGQGRTTTHEEEDGTEEERNAPRSVCHSHMNISAARLQASQSL